ncbi:bifunctional oligoribonuclease/PAP phosphatase NrnA [Thermomicrobium sp. 4228-Ro]|uniref:DHH family phosphoesterase n=1 Tax=Thermomicrobium sp. 4228-Ro TaxID=2993937 RepID=UPI002249444C|nr:bifunctional oligoribonuclease/PAP phosphatase NrnA [Thermomicrobium sp. 4228-Ro]MCX2726138.1 bifunctional oligoribonuclease/PAP phosphatase NrnA [Thermomicrobium sp. 4228-Ro]
MVIRPDRNDSILGSRQAAWQLVTAARSLLITTHANPDADAVASVLALRLAVVDFVPCVACSTGDFTAPRNLGFLPGANTLLDSPTQLPDEVETIVLLDCADPTRLGPLYHARQAWFDGSIPLVNVDHHVTNSLFGLVNLVDAMASSTTEVLARWLLDVGIDLTPDIATCLLTGLYGDTLSFQTSSTTPVAHELAALLLRKGARQEEIVTNLFRRKPVSTILLWGAALSRIRLEPPVIWTEITSMMLEMTGATAAEGEGIVNFLSGAEGTVVAILFYEHPEGWRVSVRSADSLVDVAAICQHFGGGGHPRAAGCRLPAGESSRRAFLDYVRAAVIERMSSELPTG